MSGRSGLEMNSRELGCVGVHGALPPTALHASLKHTSLTLIAPLRVATLPCLRENKNIYIEL